MTFFVDMIVSISPLSIAPSTVGLIKRLIFDERFAILEFDT